MKYVTYFIKGIAVGIGGIAPGLSGSVMLIILGLYEKAIKAIGTLFSNFKKNILFLIPLVLGFGIGVLLFSRIVDFMLERYQFGTRYLFLGLVIGTIPLFYKEVKKKGFNNKYYLAIAGALVFGFFLFWINRNWFPVITEPNFIQSILLGVAVAGSSIIPGVDSAVILSALGLYELYVNSLAELNISILLPALIGLAGGAVLISSLMHFLIKRFYTITFSIIFGLFLSIVPNVLNISCTIDCTSKAILAVFLVIFGCITSFYLENITGNNQTIKKLLTKKEQKKSPFI
ncbi:MAG: DUF368 domain-containing protein [Eubacteriales bacterium]|nr:DUF368 domain-containing protein [Eubacteriales bacterium]